jgi:hypothetical protein
MKTFNLFRRLSGSSRYKTRKRTYGATPRKPLVLERLEDRTVLSTLYVVPPGTPLVGSNFGSYSDAYQAAANGDTIQIQHGTSVSSVGGGVSGFRTDGGLLGSDTMTIDDTSIHTGEMVTISGGGATVPDQDETRLVIQSRLDPSSNPGVFVNTLTLNRPLTFDHSGLSNSKVIAAVPGMSSTLVTGYAVGDLVVLSGGTFSTPAIFSVHSVGGLFGTPTALDLVYSGSYSVPTATSNIATTTNGQGSGLTVNPVYSNGLPATVTTLGTIGIDKSLTIQGDAGAPAVISSQIEVLPGTTGVVFAHINYTNSNPLLLDAGSEQTTIVNSFLTGVDEVIGPGRGNQGNILSGNVITDHAFMNGDLNINTADQITDNVFTVTTPGSFPLFMINNNGARVQGNTFHVDGSQPNSVIEVVNCQNIQITNNTVHITNPDGQNNAIFLLASAVQSGHMVSATIANNVLDTAGGSTGISIRKNINTAPTDSSMTATIVGNDFHNNLIGIDIQGDGLVPGAVNSGDTGLTSPGGNNFRGFTAAGTSGGHFAIYLHNTSLSSAVIAASNNIWSVTDPNTVIKDGTHNTAVGGGANGTGLIDVVTSHLTPDQQFVQTLYNHYLGRTGQVSELNLWVGALPSLGRSGVVSAIIHADEGLKNIVDHLYLKFLGRPFDAAGERGWIDFLKHGGTVEQVIASFTTSAEYIDHVKDTFGRVDSSYVQSLFNNFLGRSGSSDEINAFVGVLPSMGRAAVVNDFLSSTEYRANAVLQLYFTVLHRTMAPSTAELLGWANSSLDLLTIEINFASTDEFYGNGG